MNILRQHKSLRTLGWVLLLIWRAMYHLRILRPFRRKGEAIHSERKRETKKERKRERERERQWDSVAHSGVACSTAVYGQCNLVYCAARMFENSGRRRPLKSFHFRFQTFRDYLPFNQTPPEGRRSNEEQEASHNDDGTETSPMATNQYGMFSRGVTLLSPGWWQQTFQGLIVFLGLSLNMIKAQIFHDKLLSAQPDREG